MNDVRTFGKQLVSQEIRAIKGFFFSVGEGEGILHDYYKENIIKRNHQKAATGFMSTKNSKKTRGKFVSACGSMDVQTDASHHNDEA